jgi:hypothetical protein
MLRFFRKYKLTFDVGFVIVALMLSFAEWYDVFTGGEKWRWMFGAWLAVIAVVKVFDIVEYLRKGKNSQSHSNEISNTMKNEKIS